MKDIFKVGKYKFKSRLIVGTGKYKNFSETAKAINASGADMVTVAIRRIDLANKECECFTILAVSDMMKGDIVMRVFLLIF